MDKERAILALPDTQAGGASGRAFEAVGLTPEHIAAALSRIVAHTRAASPARGVSRETEQQDSWIRPMLDTLPAPVYATDAEGWLTYFNEAAAQFAGRVPVIGRDRWCIAHRLYRLDGTPLSKDECPMAIAVREERPVRGIEVIAEREDGTRIVFAPYPTPIRAPDGRLVGAVNVLIDIGDRKRAEDEVAHLASHDLLTGLPNRVALSRRVGELLEQRAADAPFAVMKLDILGFRHINDRFGHAAGDEVLRAIAQCLNTANGDGFLARIGADKFALIVPEPGGRDRQRALAERLRAAVRGTGPRMARPGIDIAIGCAVYPGDGASERTLLAHAASALYRAKRASEPVVFYDADADLAVREREVLRNEMRRAIAGGELCLAYQPQVARDGTVSAFEALVRWRHPHRGLIAPAKFIALAEEDGSIVEMSEWILLAACREAAAWPNGQRIAVNISPVHFRKGDLPQLVARILAETGLAPGRLELEVTEGVMIDDFDVAMKILQDLRILGVRIALDDFGTGYSSLSYLQSFPFNTLKIDRSFTENLGRVERSSAIIRSIVGLGHALGLEVAAEGIECQEQLDFLQAEGCDLFQGFFTGRPADIAVYGNLTGVSAPPMWQQRRLVEA